MLSLIFYIESGLFFKIIVRMERFAIKIDKSVKARLKNLCRLCGIDNPNQIEILNANEWIDLTIEGEVPLNRKIAECVGVEVMKNDRMPQRICTLCVDKINDFYEFREMCQATNVQTRKLLNLPEITKAKASKKVTIKTEEDSVESILGISGTEVKLAEEKVQKGGKKAKKSATATSTVTNTSNDHRFRGMTKREIEITLELERIKQEEEEETIKTKQTETSTNRTKNGKKRKLKANEKGSADAPLLAPKEPNQRERKREMEQKRIEKKRKTDTKVKSAPPSKKIKKEPGISCLVCEERFSKVTVRDAHLGEVHSPKVADYGCSSCHEQFLTIEENIAHNEWHFKSNVPYTCVICNDTFQKVNTFQKHQTNCTHPSFTESFACNIYCSLCDLEFETQNLYDWHKCFISDNSPCPQCARMFIKRTVLIKHMFKCAGPPAFSAGTAAAAVAGAAAPKKGKAKAKKKTAKGAQKTKTKLSGLAQNSVKFEPETIIEENVDDGDAFDAVENSYMDTHFADSDDEFEPVNSIIPTIETVDSAASTKEIVTDTTIDPSASENVENNLSNVVIRQNLDHPLLECRVKLEPLDVSSLTVPAPAPAPAPQPSQQQPLTVPPLTIRIKKEVIRPGYGDEFDVRVAHSIKQERIDETYELASTSSASKTQRSAHKKLKHDDKLKKLYKKPALLAIKIKQERMERETTDDGEYNDSYQDFSIPSDDYNMGTMANQPFEPNPLPIITQIHSVIGPSTIIPMAIDQSSTPQMLISQTQSSDSQVPFTPIRIKSEFQRPLSPTILPPPPLPSPPLPVIDSVTSQQLDESASETQLIDNVDNIMVTANVTDENTTENKESEQLPESGNKESEAQPSDMEPEQIDSDANSTLNNEMNVQPKLSPRDTDSATDPVIDPVTDPATDSATISATDSAAILGSLTVTNELSQLIEQTNEENINEKVSENQSTENCEIVENSQPVPVDGEHVGIDTKADEYGDKEIISSQIECLSKIQEIPHDQLEKPQVTVTNFTANEKVVINHTNENDFNTDSTSQHSLGSFDKEIDSLVASDKDAQENEQILRPIEPICDNDIVAMDPDMENENSNISPLMDFIEPSANDDSLNFIDQLVHEVADTIGSQVDTLGVDDENDKVEFQTDALPNDASNIPFDGTNLNYSPGDEADSKARENVDKSSVDESLLALSDMPDLDIPDDLLPVLNATEPKSNGSEMNTCPEMDNNTPTKDDIANLMPANAIDSNNSPKLQQPE